MLFRNVKRSGWDTQPALVVLPAPMKADEDSNETQSEAELRRELYERIAQAGAMAEIEDYSRRLWSNR